MEKKYKPGEPYLDSNLAGRLLGETIIYCAELKTLSIQCMIDKFQSERRQRDIKFYREFSFRKREDREFSEGKLEDNMERGIIGEENGRDIKSEVVVDCNKVEEYMKKYCMINGEKRKYINNEK